MTLTELAKHLSVAPRQIRFLIAEAILPAANKTGRSADAYGEEHVSAAERYFALYRLGMKPSSIKVLLAFDSAVPIVQFGGVELRVSPNADPASLNVDEIIERVSTALKTYVAKG